MVLKCCDTTTNTSSVWEAFPTVPTSAGQGNLANGARISINSTDIFLLPGSDATNTFRHTLSNTSDAWVSYPAFTQIGPTYDYVGNIKATETAIFVADYGTGDTFLRDIADTTSAWATSTVVANLTNATFAKDDTYVYLNDGSGSKYVYRRALADTSTSWTRFSQVLPAQHTNILAEP